MTLRVCAHEVPVGRTTLTVHKPGRLLAATGTEGTVIVHVEDENHVRLPFLRQQIAKREGRASMCLADFISHYGDWIGGFAVSIHGIEPHLARFRVAVDDYSDILLKALADRLAEAFAERLHHYVRTALWGYSEGEQLTNEALIKEQYRGIRPAPGYPACPDHSLKPLLFKMLDAHHKTGISLTESFAMLPTAAQALVEASQDLYARVQRLDVSAIVPVPQPSPARSLLSRLERSL